MIYSTVQPLGKLWTRTAASVFAVHVAAVGALFVQFTPAFVPTAEPPAIAVELAPPSAPPALIHDAPTPRQVEAPDQVPREQRAPNKLPFDPPPEQRIASVTPDVILPAKSEEPRPVNKSNPLPPAPTTTEQAAPALRPDRKVAAMVTGGASAGSATAADLWDARVRARIELMKRYPAFAARQNQQDEVRLLLTIDRAGRLVNGRINGSRGFDLLDRAALEAVQRAAPFPKPPPEIAGDQIRVSVIVRFFKRSRAG